jgi:hypothetical protein
LNDGPVPGVEILVVARPEMDSTAGSERYSPETIELLLVCPIAALGQLFCTLQEHRSDESGFGFLVLHPGTSLLQPPLAGKSSYLRRPLLKSKANETLS